MTQAKEDRWEEARRQLIGRWRRIVDRIGAHDEAGVLELCNVMDEFCDEADALRAGVGGGGTRCQFCRGFTGTGGCLGLLGEVDHAVLGGRWEVAHRLAEDYIARLEGMRLVDPVT